MPMQSSHRRKSGQTACQIGDNGHPLQIPDSTAKPGQSLHPAEMVHAPPKCSELMTLKAATGAPKCDKHRRMKSWITEGKAA